MRRPGKWMQWADERILEVLQEEGNLQPGSIREVIIENTSELEYSNGHIGRRCRILTEYGLLVKYGAGVYSITEEGEAFLDGDLDAGELSDPSEE